MNPQPLVRRHVVNPLLDGVELADPFQRLTRQRRGAADGVDAMELAAHVRPAGGLDDLAVLNQPPDPA